MEEEKQEYREYVSADRPLYEEISTDTAEQIEEQPEKSECSEMFRKNVEEEETGTILLSDFEDDEDEKTVLLVPQPDGKAYLENMKTKEKSYIRKNNVKIGKKKEKVDIWIKENPTVIYIGVVQGLTVPYIITAHFICNNAMFPADRRILLYPDIHFFFFLSNFYIVFADIRFFFCF